MSIVKGPLFSLDADGTIGKSLSYSKKKQNSIVSKYSKPGDVSPGESSPRQKDQRSIIRLITIHWQCMDDIDRITWETAAKAARFKGSGYHYFLHLAQSDLLTYLGLEVYLSMNYENAGIVPDLSGNGNNGTLMPVYPCDCPTLLDSYNINQGKALNLDGPSNYLFSRRNSVIDNSLNNFTISYYLKYTVPGFSGFVPGVHKGSGTGAIGYSLFSEYDHPRAEIRTDSSARVVIRGSSNVNDGKWHNIVCTFDRNSYMTIYTDSIYDSRKDISAYSGQSLYTATHLYIGTILPYFSYSTVDNILIYNLVLPEKEIKLNYSLSK